MAFKGQNQPLKDEQLGAFSGYIRRPKPYQTGMVAEIFGENGDDADTILALSLSKLQDIQVFVNIYLIKDPNGKIMKQGDNYPIISSFLAFVRRSQPKKDGMLAQFFAPNGDDADNVALLSKSEYQDCLVFVDVRGSLASKDIEKIAQENIIKIDENYAEKITKQQRIEITKKEKQFKKMNETLQLSEFLYRIEVLKSLGTGEDFKNWLEDTQLCSHSDRTCMNEAFTIELPIFPKPFNLLPCCSEHKNDLLSDEHFKLHEKYYEMKHRLLAKDWALHKMREKFSFDGKGEPDPSKVIDWANSKGIAKYLPAKYDIIL